MGCMYDGNGLVLGFSSSSALRRLGGPVGARSDETVSSNWTIHLPWYGKASYKSIPRLYLFFVLHATRPDSPS